MSRSRLRLFAARFRCCSTLLLAGLFASTVWAAEPKPDQLSATADELVREALHLEIYGMQAERDELLRRAEAMPAGEKARWHQGQLQLDGRWLPMSALADSWLAKRSSQRYLSQRDSAEDTVAGQLTLANWCREAKLTQQEIAHLNRVIQINPNHGDARQRLGYRRVNGMWVSQQELDEARQDAREMLRNLSKWKPKMVALRKQLNERSEMKREAAADKIEDLREVTAIPAMEDVLSSTSPEAAQLVVAALDHMPEFAASVSLARHAVFSPYEEVRERAATALQARPLHEFVPVMLSSMYTPVQSQSVVDMDPNGRLVYRHRFLREGQSERQLLNEATEYERVSVAGGNRAETLARAMQDAMRRAQRREAQVLQQNVMTQLLNQRIAGVLRQATNQAYGSSPNEWWDWWINRNDMYISTDKGTRVLNNYDQVSIADRARTRGASGGGAGGSMRTCECLVAGTPLWTARGPVAVEEMQVGDLVLAKDPETGEVTLKPVIETTVRPAGPVIRIELEGEIIQASAGHLFWISGEGWISARQIKSGMLLHTACGAVRVSQVALGEPAETYNVIVQDCHTYFAGERQVLSHDNAPLEPTNAVVPGLKP